MSKEWFQDTPVIGLFPKEKAVLKLRELGETELAEAVERPAPGKTFGPSDWWSGPPKPWQHTAHSFGHVGAVTPGAEEPMPVHQAGAIAPDKDLMNARVRITLQALRVAAYPGKGIHRVLFDFYARNQVASGVEDLHFNSTFRVQEGESAAVVGYPIFVGLNVGADGVAFKCFTVNVQNDDDEAFLGLLESDVFRSGLKLVSTLQPAIAPLSEMALGFTKAIAKRNRNVPVQDFYLGLDFTAGAFGARLAQGSYVAVQIPESFRAIWDWKDWVYIPTGARLVHREDHDRLIPYNYVVFGVSRYEGS